MFGINRLPQIGANQVETDPPRPETQTGMVSHDETISKIAQLYQAM